MKTKRFITTTVIALILAMFTVTSVLAGSITTSGITLSWPNYPLSGPALLSCEPWEVASANTVSLSGVPAGSNIKAQFGWSIPFNNVINWLPPLYFNNVSGTLVIPVSYPMNSAQWPLVNPVTNERAISVGVAITVTRPDGSVVKLVGKQWWVRCLPPPAPAQGCTPGYWKQDQHFDSWVGYAPSDDFNTVFGVSATFDPHSLLDALWLGGGGENALARHAVAAILNVSAGLNYQFTLAQIIAGVQNAYATGNFEPFKNQLDAANNAGCPLN